MSICIFYNQKWPVSLTQQLQASQCEKAIKEEFEKLHLFLQEEENSTVKMLRQEEKMKMQVMCEKLENIKDQIQTLTTNISDIETTIRMKDLPFLHVCYTLYLHIYVPHLNWHFIIIYEDNLKLITEWNLHTFKK